jgi:quercetin dioxygenase-like cupin family protein
MPGPGAKELRMTTSPTEQRDRRRPPPRERFAGVEKLFNLTREFDQLPSESVIRQGHMQKALYRHGPITTAIFTFEADGAIDQHVVDGESILHVLEGRLFVRTSLSEYTLGPGEVLLIDPGVPLDLRAIAPTRMLMMWVLIDGGRVREAD